MKKNCIFIILILVLVLNCFKLNSNKVLSEVPQMDGEELYKIYVLNWIDGPDIPAHVKKFANDNNCFYITKNYYWSYVIFKDKGGIYFCGKKGKAQVIYEQDNNMRFARWYEKRKFRKLIFDD